jgi:hypothetical protein
MTIFKNELKGNVLKWEEGKYGTFTIEEILGEQGITILKAKLAGYTIVKDSKKGRR